MIEKNPNFLLQSNFFTQSVMRDVTEVQKDIVYYFQTIINFRDSNPSDEILFNYNHFLDYKNVDKKNFYSVSELLDICTGLIHINGVFYNTNTKTTEFFNLIDSVSVSDENANEFIIRFANWGKIFFYEKYALAYADKSNLQYTQIEKNIIDLKGDKRKKLFELFSQYKKTGIYNVSLEQLKILLGFIVYKNHKNKSFHSQQMQLKFLFEPMEVTNDSEKVEYLVRWSDFKRVFLDPAIEEFNTNQKLDISHISYEAIKSGRKITNLNFKFQKRLAINNLSEEHKAALSYFTMYGLTEAQVLFLIQRIGHENMYNRFNQELIFNPHYDNKDHPNYRQKNWFIKSKNEVVKNLGGFLYDKVFPELNN